MLSANINVQVFVKLTSHGEKILTAHYDSFNFPAQNRPEKDFSGYYKFVLWELMNIFGSCLSNGAETPFEENKIYFCK